ncbi:MAG: hypothetical protein HY328_17495 [Chloroflexi bacterium]|nr:hypothetical protein [Chloroflexota bacterium]
MKRAILKPGTIRKMLQMIAATRPVEIGCDECFEQLDRFAELELAGKNATEAMPLVQEHLERCSDCREEFELLLSMMKAVTDNDSCG